MGFIACKIYLSFNEEYILQIKDSYTSNGIIYFTPPPPLLSATPNNTESTTTQSLSAEANIHFPSEGMDMLYLAENKHFWHIARREFIYQELSRILTRFCPDNSFKHTKILDVGAGTGSVTRHFLEQGFDNIALGEIHPKGLEYAKTYGIKDLYCMDLLDVPFRDEFDCIFAFDVLEHIDEDLRALQNMKSMLKNNEKSLLALSVPAHKWLWNAHDVSVHHKRRYTKAALTKLMLKCGFEIVCARYFFVSITPLLWARAILHNAPYPSDSVQDRDSKLHDSSLSDSSNGAGNIESTQEETLRDTPPPKIINSSLLALCRLENKLLNILPQHISSPFGGSLLVVGKTRSRN